MVWDSHLFQNFPQFIVIHTAKGFGIVNKAFQIEMAFIEIDVFLELFISHCFICTCPLLPEPLTKETVLSSLNIFISFVKIKLSIDAHDLLTKHRQL